MADKRPSVLDFSIDDVAIQLTTFDLPLFCAIQPDELQSSAWTKKNKMQVAPNVVRFIQRFNHISFWVVQEILRETLAEPKHRAHVMAHFMRIAKKLHELHNLHAVFAIISAMQSASIFRLKRTWNVFSRRYRDQKIIFDKLTDLFSESDNFTKLRSHCDSLTLNSTSKSGVIPYLGIYLTDLVYIELSGAGDVRQYKVNNVLRLLSEMQSQCITASKFINNVEFLNLDDNETAPSLVCHDEKCVEYLKSSIKFIDELQKFVEDDNYKLSLRLEPPEDFNDSKDNKSGDSNNQLFAQLNISPSKKASTVTGCFARNTASVDHNSKSATIHHLDSNNKYPMNVSTAVFAKRKPFKKGHRKCNSEGGSNLFFGCSSSTVSRSSPTASSRNSSRCETPQIFISSSENSREHLTRSNRPLNGTSDDGSWCFDDGGSDEAPPSCSRAKSATNSTSKSSFSILNFNRKFSNPTDRVSLNAKQQAKRSIIIPPPSLRNDSTAAAPTTTTFEPFIQNIHHFNKPRISEKPKIIVTPSSNFTTSYSFRERDARNVSAEVDTDLHKRRRGGYHSVRSALRRVMSSASVVRVMQQSQSGDVHTSNSDFKLTSDKSCVNGIPSTADNTNIVLTNHLIDGSPLTQRRRKEAATHPKHVKRRTEKSSGLPYFTDIAKLPQSSLTSCIHSNSGESPERPPSLIMSSYEVLKDFDEEDDHDELEEYVKMFDGEETSNGILSHKKPFSSLQYESNTYHTKVRGQGYGRVLCSSQSCDDLLTADTCEKEKEEKKKKQQQPFEGEEHSKNFETKIRGKNYKIQPSINFKQPICIYQGVIRRKCILKDGKPHSPCCLFSSSSSWSEKIYMQLLVNSSSDHPSLLYFNKLRSSKSNKYKTSSSSTVITFNSTPFSCESILGWLVMIPRVAASTTPASSSQPHFETQNTVSSKKEMKRASTFHLIDPVNRNVFKFKTDSPTFASHWVSALHSCLNQQQQQPISDNKNGGLLYQNSNFRGDIIYSHPQHGGSNKRLSSMDLISFEAP